VEPRLGPRWRTLFPNSGGLQRDLAPSQPAEESTFKTCLPKTAVPKLQNLAGTLAMAPGHGRRPSLPFVCVASATPKGTDKNGRGLTPHGPIKESTREAYPPDDARTLDGDRGSEANRVERMHPTIRSACSLASRVLTKVRPSVSSSSCYALRVALPRPCSGRVACLTSRFYTRLSLSRTVLGKGRQ